jgi:hypothetical protein
MREKNSVVFVLAHSNGDWLKLSGSEMDCQRFARMLHEGRDENHAALLVLNCCLSATGGDQRSLLSAVAQRGFCGLIGTGRALSLYGGALGGPLAAASHAVRQAEAGTKDGNPN